MLPWMYLTMKPVFFFYTQKPEKDEWGNTLDALEHALNLEKEVNQALLDLHKLATEKADPHVSKLEAIAKIERWARPKLALGDFSIFF